MLSIFFAWLHASSSPMVTNAIINAGSTYLLSASSPSHGNSDFPIISLYQFFAADATSSINHPKDPRVEDGAVDSPLPRLWAAPTFFRHLPLVAINARMCQAWKCCCPNTLSRSVQGQANAQGRSNAFAWTMLPTMSTQWMPPMTQIQNRTRRSLCTAPSHNWYVHVIPCVGTCSYMPSVVHTLNPFPLPTPLKTILHPYREAIAICVDYHCLSQ